MLRLQVNLFFTILASYLIVKVDTILHSLKTDLIELESAAAPPNSAVITAQDP